MPRPNFSFEKRYWKKGIRVVIGVDEVGRGSLAGPVVAAVTSIKYQVLSIKDKKGRIKNIHDTKYIIHNTILKLGIDDSKRLKPKQREQLVGAINKYFYTAVGQAGVAEIDRLGIVKATGRAMRRAVIKIQNPKSPPSPRLRRASKIQIKSKIQNQNFFMIIDGYPIKYLPGGLRRQKGIVNGDQKSISIAAASIIAKVYRDRLMRKLSRQYPLYKWGRNKGYGTKAHLQVLKKFGSSPHHRKLFIDGI